MDIMSALEHLMVGDFDDPKAVEGRPQAGDAVILTGPWSIAKAGDVGIIGGLVGRSPEECQITFRYSCFRDNTSVSVSGGPGTFGIDYKLLKPTGKTIKVWCWKWKGGISGAGRGENYEIDVPLWEWDGQDLLAYAVPH